MGLVCTVPGRPQLGHYGLWAPESVRETNERGEGIQERMTRVQSCRKYLCVLFKVILAWVPPEQILGQKFRARSLLGR